MKIVNLLKKFFYSRLEFSAEPPSSIKWMVKNKLISNDLVGVIFFLILSATFFSLAIYFLDYKHLWNMAYLWQ